MGADLRRGAAAVLLVFEAVGRGGLKVGALRLTAGLEVGGGMIAMGKIEGILSMNGASAQA